MTRFWVGGYGADMGGDAVGIGVLAGDEGREPTTLAHRGVAVQTASPSWLAQHPTHDVVYAALEGQGAVQAFRRTGEERLQPWGEPVAVGDSPCHVAVAPGGGYLVAACYGDGAVVRVALAADGMPGAARVADAAVDPYGPTDAGGPAEPSPADELRTALGLGGPAPAPEDAIRAAIAAGGVSLDVLGAAMISGIVADDAALLAAAGAVASDDAPAPRDSHAHATAFLPDGRIATTDLGVDLVRIWRPTPTGLRRDHEVVLPRGVGPRHMVVHPSEHLHVVTEYSNEVFTLAAGADGRWALVAATTVAPTAQVGVDFPAELARSRDGATLYTALRGSNTIAALRVRGDGGIVEPLALADAGVDWPRHHLVHDGALLVSGQRSDDIAVIDLDERTGAPRSIRHRTPAPAPTHLLLARDAR